MHEDGFNMNSIKFESKEREVDYTKHLSKQIESFQDRILGKRRKDHTFRFKVDCCHADNELDCVLNFEQNN